MATKVKAAQRTYRLLTMCEDKVGIVAKVSDYIQQHGGWLLDASYHSDRDNGLFFMRNEVLAESLNVDFETFKSGFANLANDYEMSWYMTDTDQQKQVALLASHERHCLSDLLSRYQEHELPCEIKCIISNHKHLESLADHYEIPYHYVPVDKSNKAEHFAQVDSLLLDYQIDTVVLAKYMQIMPKDLTDKYQGRMINIHHSFLPSFIGANPYGQAFERGVKLIGATCHFVTSDLDQGPIIEQGVERVSHRDSKDDLVRLGRDVERLVLARGLRHHLQDRVMICGNKTVVFD